MAIEKNLSKNDIYLRLASDSKNSVKAALAENIEISESIQLLLIESGSNSVYRALASNSCISRGVLKSLFDIKDADTEAADWIIQGLCENTSLPDEIVESLLLTIEENSYFMLLKCPSLNKMQKQQLLAKMIHPSQYPSVLEDAASSDALLPKQIDFLINHESENVRTALARNPGLDKNSQLVLAKDHSVMVRKILALNVNLSKDAEELLKKNPESDVQVNLDRRPLSKNIKDKSISQALPDYEKILTELNQSNLINIGLCSETPVDVLDQIFETVLPTCDSWVAVALAQNSNLNEKHLSSLLKSKNAEVHKALASNKKIPLSIMDKLSKNKDPIVRSIVANQNRYVIPSFMSS